MTTAIPDSWAATSLFDICRPTQWKTVSIRQLLPSGYPTYGAGGLIGFYSEYNHSSPTIMISCRGTCGQVYISKPNSYLTGNVMALDDLMEGACHLNYLAYFLQSRGFADAISGSAQAQITRASLGNVFVPLAPKPEQIRIVEKLEELLSNLDAGVAELKAAQRKLAQYSQSLLKAAVEGALTADWRAARARSGEPQETGADLLQRILTERRARWEAKQLAKYAEQGKTPPKGWQAKYPEPVTPDTTELPNVPSDWTWASLDQIVSDSLIGLDRGHEMQSHTEGNAHYVKMNNVTMIGEVDTSALVKIHAADSELRRFALKPDDILFNTRNSKELVGKTGIVRDVEPNTVYNNNLMRMRLVGNVLARFLCYQMCSPNFRARMETVKKATTSVAAVYAKDLFPLQVVIPYEEEQAIIVDVLDEHFAQIRETESVIARALSQSAAQRKNILKAAFAGQLVPQDPHDEPASALLERIRAERAKQTGAAKPRGRKPRTTA